MGKKRSRPLEEKIEIIQVYESEGHSLRGYLWLLLETTNTTKISGRYHKRQRINNVHRQGLSKNIYL